MDENRNLFDFEIPKGNEQCFSINFTHTVVPDDHFKGNFGEVDNPWKEPEGFAGASFQIYRAPGSSNCRLGECGDGKPNKMSALDELSSDSESSVNAEKFLDFGIPREELNQLLVENPRGSDTYVLTGMLTLSGEGLKPIQGLSSPEFTENEPPEKDFENHEMNVSDIRNNFNFYGRKKKRISFDSSYDDLQETELPSAKRICAGIFKDFSGAVCSSEEKAISENDAIEILCRQSEVPGGEQK